MHSYIPIMHALYDNFSGMNILVYDISIFMHMHSNILIMHALYGDFS
jgi:hypothetical protein